VAGSHCSAAKVGKLLRVDLDRKAELLRTIKHTAHLLRRKSNPFTEGIYRISKVLCLNSREHFIADKADVVVTASFILWRQCMYAEESGQHFDGTKFANLSRNPQHFQLCIKIQPVTGLDFQQRYTFCQ